MPRKPKPAVPYNLRVPADLLATWRAAAKKRGIGLSEMIRQAMDRDLLDAESDQLADIGRRVLDMAEQYRLKLYREGR